MKPKKTNAVNMQEDEDFSVYPLYPELLKDQGKVKKISNHKKKVFSYLTDTKKEVNGKYY